MARKGGWEWEDHLAQGLSTKPAEVVQKACLVLEKHGCRVEKLKGEFYTALYDEQKKVSCTAVAHFVNLCSKSAIRQLDSGTCTNCICMYTHTHTHTHRY